MKKTIKIIAWIVAALMVVVSSVMLYIYYCKPDVGDAPYLSIKKTPQRIARGKYLANHVAVCMDCHSKRDWSRYAGPMAAEGIGGGGEVFNQEMGFPGSFYAPNITPFALSNWSDGEILRAITSGVDREGKPLFPVMAYHRFGKMDQEDVLSIIAYLRTLAPVEKTIPESKPDFPVSLLMHLMPEKPEYQRIPDEKNRVAYGRYLANATGCVDCHSQTDKGAVIEGTEYGGGMEFGQPAGIVRSPNITKDRETGIGNWSKEAFVARFKLYADVNYQSPVLGPDDLNTPMPWTMYAGMKVADLEAIYDYLQTVTPIRNAVRREEKTKKP